MLYKGEDVKIPIINEEKDYNLKLQSRNTRQK